MKSTYYAPLVSLLRKHLGYDIEKSGSVLYNGWSTLKPGFCYFMGLNPGGDTKETPDSIRKQLDGLEEFHCAYEDEDWNSGFEIGKNPHQVRVKEIAEALGQNIRSVCAVNAIFLRSANAKKLNDISGLWNKCWPVHQYLLSIVKPSIIICLGNGDSRSSFSLLKGKIKQNLKVEYCGTNGYRDGKYFKGILDIEGGTLPCTVVGVPHPSRFPVTESLKVFLKNL